MTTFTIADLDQALKDRDSSLADSSSFAARRTSAAKQALSQIYTRYKNESNPWARASTLATAGLSTGSAVINTSIGDCYRAALATDMLAVADDTLFLNVSTSTFKLVPRISIDDVNVSTTLEGFWENHGELFFYTKDAEFTAPGTLHFNYWRIPTIDTATPTNTIDIDPTDFTAFVDSVASFMAGS